MLYFSRSVIKGRNYIQSLLNKKIIIRKSKSLELCIENFIDVELIEHLYGISGNKFITKTNKAEFNCFKYKNTIFISRPKIKINRNIKPEDPLNIETNDFSNYDNFNFLLNSHFGNFSIQNLNTLKDIHYITTNKILNFHIINNRLIINQQKLYIRDIKIKILDNQYINIDSVPFVKYTWLNKIISRIYDLPCYYTNNGNDIAFIMASVRSNGYLSAKFIGKYIKYFDDYTCELIYYIHLGNKLSCNDIIIYSTCLSDEQKKQNIAILKLSDISKLRNTNDINQILNLKEAIQCTKISFSKNNDETFNLEITIAEQTNQIIKSILFRGWSIKLPKLFRCARHNNIIIGSNYSPENIQDFITTLNEFSGTQTTPKYENQILIIDAGANPSVFSWIPGGGKFSSSTGFDLRIFKLAWYNLRNEFLYFETNPTINISSKNPGYIKLSPGASLVYLNKYNHKYSLNINLPINTTEIPSLNITKMISPTTSLEYQINKPNFVSHTNIKMEFHGEGQYINRVLKRFNINTESDSKSHVLTCGNDIYLKFYKFTNSMLSINISPQIISNYIDIGGKLLFNLYYFKKVQDNIINFSIINGYAAGKVLQSYHEKSDIRFILYDEESISNFVILFRLLALKEIISTQSIIGMNFASLQCGGFCNFGLTSYLDIIDLDWYKSHRILQLCFSFGLITTICIMYMLYIFFAFGLRFKNNKLELYYEFGVINNNNPFIIKLGTPINPNNVISDI